MTPWWRPRLGWYVVAVKRAHGRVHVEMAHPDWPWPRFINAECESDAVAWAMILRNGAVQWSKRR